MAFALPRPWLTSSSLVGGGLNQLVWYSVLTACLSSVDCVVSLAAAGNFVASTALIKFVMCLLFVCDTWNFYPILIMTGRRRVVVGGRWVPFVVGNDEEQL